MKKTITEVETAIENRIAELEEEYELDIYDRNDIREEEYQKAGWRHDPFPEELEEEDEEEEEDWHYHSMEERLNEVGMINLSIKIHCQKYRQCIFIVIITY